MNIEQVRKELIEWETNSLNKENIVLYEARAKELRDLLSNLEGERRLGREEGIKKGIEEGLRAARQEGLMQVKREIAIKLLQKGMDRSLVLEVTELSEEELKKISKENGLDE